MNAAALKHVVVGNILFMLCERSTYQPDSELVQSLRPSMDRMSLAALKQMELILANRSFPRERGPVPATQTMCRDARPWLGRAVVTVDGRRGVVDQDACMAAPVEVRVRFEGNSTEWVMVQDLTEEREI